MDRVPKTKPPSASQEKGAPPKGLQKLLLANVQNPGLSFFLIVVVVLVDYMPKKWLVLLYARDLVM